MTTIDPLAPDMIHKYAVRGRALQAQAIRSGILAAVGWIGKTLRVTIGRRAETKLGCSDCGVHA